MLRRLFLTPLLVLACIAVPMNAAAPAQAASPADPANNDVERGFTETVQPFLNYVLHELPRRREAGRATGFAPVLHNGVCGSGFFPLESGAGTAHRQGDAAQRR